MKTLILPLVLMLTVALPASATRSNAEIAQCKALAQTLPGKKAELEQLKAERDALAAEVEALDIVKADAIEMSSISTADAEKAVTLAADYETAKKSLLEMDAALMFDAKAFRQDVSSYNSMCAAD